MKTSITETVKAIVEIEWNLFDQVNNIGGRASCQDDKTTFFIMRSSQLMAWSAEMQESYHNDLKQALRDRRNPLTEKYAYMMECTSPKEFEQIRAQLPPRTAEKDAMIDRICTLHVKWQEELSAQYPKLCGRGRSIRKEEDTIYNTSFETYLWGELATYSEHTIRLYADYAERLQKEGKSLGKMILENTITQYGFSSLEAAEAKA